MRYTKNRSPKASGTFWSARDHCQFICAKAQYVFRTVPAAGTERRPNPASIDSVINLKTVIRPAHQYLAAGR